MSVSPRPSSDGKVVLLGSSSVGKTALVTRVITNSFELDQQPTVGAQYSTKTFHTEGGTITLRIWDTAGQERYRTLAPMYYQGSDAAIVVFSLTDESTLRDAEKWVQELMEHFEEAPKLYLVGNKADLESDRTVDVDRATDAATAIKAEYFETSAKTGENVTEVFNAVADFLHRRAAAPKPTEPVVSLTQVKRSGCRC